MFDFLDPVIEAIKSFFMFFKPVFEFIVSTKVPEQAETFDVKGLFTNYWFLVPYIGMYAWYVYKKAVNSIIIALLLTGAWAFFGTPYAQNIMAQDDIQLDAILPLVAGACTILGIIVYIVFFKDE